MTKIRINAITPKSGKKGTYYVIKGDDNINYYCFDAKAQQLTVGRVIEAEVEQQQGTQGTLHTIRGFSIAPPEMDLRDKSINAQVALKEAGAIVRTMLEKDMVSGNDINVRLKALFAVCNGCLKDAVIDTDQAEEPTPPGEEMEPF